MEAVTWEVLYKGVSCVEDVIWNMLHGKCYMIVIWKMLYGGCYMGSGI